MEATARVEHQESVAREAKSGINDFLGGSGEFPENPPIDEGTFGGAGVRVTGYGARRWTVGTDVLGGEGRTTARLYGSLRQDVGDARGATLRVAGGIATSPTLAQTNFRLGGLTTVRGFDYGSRQGQAFWAAQLDLAPIPGRIRPVVFIDAGQAGDADQLFETEALVGAGAGVSFFNGLLRFDLSHPLHPDTGGKLRFDIVLQAVR
jgi:outer membrane protein assembly factor BamA